MTMTACEVPGSGAIELYFYDELTPPEREAVESHLQSVETAAACSRRLA